MKTRELMNLGIPRGAAMDLVKKALRAASGQGWKKSRIRDGVAALAERPAEYAGHEVWGQAAQEMVLCREARAGYSPRIDPAPYRQWGSGLDARSVEQMEAACQLPVAVRGALMPDAHPGYGLPIGGVLATRKAVIPYAVGVDIACRMRLSVLDMPLQKLRTESQRLEKAIEKETRFGIGAAFPPKHRRQHAVLDEDWSVSPVSANLKDKAWAQLGTSGSGNHFVEFGIFSLEKADLGLEAGQYLALLSHSGSRGAGATIASHYSRLAMKRRPELPKQLKQLAWLDLDSQEGQEYWQAMQLMGHYAAANHACLHRHLLKNLGAKALATVENHHNFAWQEEHGGENVIVHRKGATPAGQEVLGVIPGSMASPCYVVRGKGEPQSLRSAAHGAGRVMSRTQAKNSLTWSAANKLLKERGVTLMSAGLDEVPMVYKNIDEVMAAQSDLVETVAVFMPQLVKMAQAGERPED